MGHSHGCRHTHAQKTFVGSVRVDALQAGCHRFPQELHSVLNAVLSVDEYATTNGQPSAPC